MKRYLGYLKYVIRHKWFVFWAGMGLIFEVPVIQWHIWAWRLFIHDWDKFYPDEFIPYARFFYAPNGTKVKRRDKTGYYKPSDTGNEAFEKAWFLHAKRNDHHWQWWVLPIEHGIKTYPMSNFARLEMLADWIGAGKAQGTPDTVAWYEANKAKMHLHDATRKWIEHQIELLKREQRLKNLGIIT